MAIVARMTTPLQLLLIEDSNIDAQIVLEELRQGDFDPVAQIVHQSDEVEKALVEKDWDVIVCDYTLPQFSALEALKLLREKQVEVPIIVVSGSVEENVAVEALKQGASDYVMKDNLTRLAPAIKRELREFETRKARKMAEEALQKEETRRENDARYAADLERSNRELEHFAAIVSHDLQNPLRKVKMFSNYLETDAGASLSPECRDYLKRIQNATSKMEHLISDLLDISRSSHQHRPLQRVSLSKLVDDVLFELKDTIRVTNAHIEVGNLPVIAGDTNQLKLLLENLIGNALKFHKKDCPPSIHIDGFICEETCIIKVQDKGIGFPQKDREKIFEIFERLHTGNQFQGNGVGLAICKKIANRHGGTITAWGEEGAGSTFIVSLPYSTSTLSV